MANKFRGEVPLKAGDDTYTLRFGTNEMVELEEKYGSLEAFKGSTGVKDVRFALTVGLRRHHPEITEADVGDLMDKVGGMEGVITFINEAFGLVSKMPPGVESAIESEAGASDPNAAAVAVGGGKTS